MYVIFVVVSSVMDETKIKKQNKIKIKQTKKPLAIH